MQESRVCSESTLKYTSFEHLSRHIELSVAFDINNTTDGKDDSAIVFNSNKGTVILRDWRYNLCFGLIADYSNVYWSNQQESAWEWEKQ